MFSEVWNENSALFKRLMKIHSNPPLLYYGCKWNYRIINLSLKRWLPHWRMTMVYEISWADWVNGGCVKTDITKSNRIWKVKCEQDYISGWYGHWQCAYPDHGPGCMGQTQTNRSLSCEGGLVLCQISQSDFHFTCAHICHTSQKMIIAR